MMNEYPRPVDDREDNKRTNGEAIFVIAAQLLFKPTRDAPELTPLVRQKAGPGTSNPSQACCLSRIVPLARELKAQGQEE
jgi:hypothetical protein